KGKTFRDDIYEQYKAHRPPMPDDLQTQVEPLLATVRAMGLPLLVVEGVEADDVIGTLATQASAHGLAVLISTGDKDMAQLVDDHVTLVNTMTNTQLDPRGVMAKFGIPAEQIVDYLALVGDTSDNIPGIPGVGPKTAVKWLKAYGGLDEIVARADAIGGKVGENLRAGLHVLPMARQLATIKRDVPLDVAPQALTLHPPDTAALTELFRHLEFKRWLGELLGPGQTTGGDATDAAPPAADAPRADYETISDPAALDRWVADLEQAELLVFDIETTSLQAMRAEIVGLSFALAPGRAAYVPLAHDDPAFPGQLPLDATLARLRPLLEDTRRPKLGHNLKYDMSVLANYDITLRGIAHDSMLESYVLDSTASRHDMDSLALKYLGYRTTPYEEVAGKGAAQINFSQVPVDKASAYAAEDADISLRLHNHLWPRLTDIAPLRRLYETVEIPLVPVLSRMERHGVLVDAERLHALSSSLAGRIREIEGQAHKAAGQAFNLGSPKQIQEILYNQQGLPVLRKTPTGQPSTGEDTLQELALDYPLPALILEYRALSKLKSTYTDKLPEQVNPRTGRVHTSYHQAVAATGRLSSSDPNLQNIPTRRPEGRQIRQAFVAPPGYKIVAADYSQIELRIMAHLSGDERLLQAFGEGLDIHRATAAEIFAVAAEAVTNEQRRSAKAINFGLIYGMSAYGLGRQLGVPRGAAQEYMEAYFRRYPKVREYMDAMREQAREAGYVETLFGRRLYLPEIRSRNAQRRQYAERAAINAPMQGSAADIIKRAMIHMDAWLYGEGGVDGRMVMQVHDELVFEIAGDQVPAAIRHIHDHMAQAAELAVPLEVDIGAGDNWDTAH
ncbi:MAG TPA: DNA polymerase I, partial [Gammaproteobacteria bacterium]|nr:DNA polymerase I [Gammaproteobacteria bacterium]